LIEPFWEGFEDRNQAARSVALRPLVMVDPVGVLRKLGDVDLPNARDNSTIQLGLIRSLARIDPPQAAEAGDAADSPV
jgi:hypothetical protein